jgi:hypothetical protein
MRRFGFLVFMHGAIPNPLRTLVPDCMLLGDMH